MKTLSALFFLLILFLVSSYPTQVMAVEALSGRLVLTGSSTVAPLAAEIGRQFEGLHPHVQIDVQTGGSSRGIADARRGLADIGMVSRALKEGESDLHSFAIAFDGITLILNKDNPIEKLSDATLVDIYRGRIRNWKAVGGKDAPITVVNKAEGRSTLELFLSHFKLSNREIKAHIIVGDNAQGIKTVAGNPDAIGYVSIGAAAYDAATGLPIKLLPVAGRKPSIENVQEGLFPIIRPLNLVTKSQPEGLVKAFIEFAQSRAVSETIKEQYFVPISK